MRNDEVARRILDTTSSGGRAPGDADGVPWATPVWFAQEDYRRIYWVSAPDARHSRNIEARQESGMVVFDSMVPPNAGQAVYLEATATRTTDGLDVFSRVAAARGAGEWGPERVSGEARLRLYRADVTAHWILAEDVDVRVPVTP